MGKAHVKKIVSCFLIFVVLFLILYGLAYFIREQRIADLPPAYQNYAREECGVFTVIPINCCLEVIHNAYRDKIPAPIHGSCPPGNFGPLPVSCVGGPMECIPNRKPEFHCTKNASGAEEQCDFGNPALK